MTVYYNDNDPYCADWLLNLVSVGELPPGRVDARGIEEVSPDDIAFIPQAHLFAGIGGWPLALALAGWPDDREVWTASCPCQPLSGAGKRQGAADPRHLWPPLYGLIAECRPPVIFGEQVAGPLGREWLAGVRADLEDLGYAVGAADLCAASVGAPHIRQRLFWVADSERGSAERHGYEVAGAPGALQEEAQQRQRVWDDPGDGSPVGGVADADVSVGQGGYADQSREGDREVPGSQAVVRPRGRSTCCAVGGVADAEGFDGWSEARGENGQKLGNGRGLGDTDELGLEGALLRSGSPQESIATPGHGGAWSRFEVVPRSNPKGGHDWCRVEPSTFPLAHGIPGRMGRLRAYGNAVVPPVAATFVRAFMESS